MWIPMASRERRALSKPMEARDPSSPSEHTIFAPRRNLRISVMDVDFSIISLQPHRIQFKIRPWCMTPDKNDPNQSIAHFLGVLAYIKTVWTNLQKFRFVQ